MKKLTFLFLILFISVAEKPVFVVTGTVFDTNGDAISGVTVSEQQTKSSTTTNSEGKYSISVSGDQSILVFSRPGYEIQKERVGSRRKIDLIMTAAKIKAEEDRISLEMEAPAEMPAPPTQSRDRTYKKALYSNGYGGAMIMHDQQPVFNTEEYDGIEENIFHQSTDKPLSTFSIDVDAASYSNVRRFLNLGQKPPKDAVRIEEMINYFTYDYEGPTDSHPFSIHTSYSQAPWNEKHLVAHIGLQGKRIDVDELPPSNLVFLIDVSGSMSAQNKLPLLKSSMKMLVNEMRPNDKISIVVYAGAAGLVLPPTDGENKAAIVSALEKLQAGGSTAGGAGIQLAYKVAKEQFVDGGNNRIILATDGDFNVGASSNAEMQRLIEEKRNQGIFLTVLGFGMGNYKDSKMEILADKGNGNYAYIDNIQEAKKVLVTEFGGTLFTIAKDVKIQVEFNPAEVQAYRLIGYENRKLRDEDFNDDTKDAGELGSGHTVTALYEIIPTGVNSEFGSSVDPLKYQNIKPVSNKSRGELLTIKFRYKQPDGDKSNLMVRTMDKDDLNPHDRNLQWATAVAGFGMLLRDSEFKGDLTIDKVLSQAKTAKGSDDYGYRREFISLVEVAGRIQ
ncbi:MAG: von Willebrand factor type A domain-containing protein [Cyclobacteriaceae bacterium]|nr:von Willebrand factor type A domain-containing protein [Cyclobacteriaceae bacterium SS2]